MANVAFPTPAIAVTSSTLTIVLPTAGALTAATIRSVGFPMPGPQGNAPVVRQVGMLPGDGTAGELIGDYHDSYVRTAEGWRFASRRFDLRVSGPTSRATRIRS